MLFIISNKRDFSLSDKSKLLIFSFSPAFGSVISGEIYNSWFIIGIRFFSFVEELKENVPCYKDYTLEEGQTIIDWLKIELGVTENSEDNTEEDSTILEEGEEEADTKKEETSNTSNIEE